MAAMALPTCPIHQALSTKELMGMIKFGADAIFSSQPMEITDEDIDLILSRGHEV